MLRSRNLFLSSFMENLVEDTFLQITHAGWSKYNRNKSNKQVPDSLSTSSRSYIIILAT